MISKNVFVISLLYSDNSLSISNHPSLTILPLVLKSFHDSKPSLLKCNLFSIEIQLMSTGKLYNSIGDIIV